MIWDTCGSKLLKLVVYRDAIRIIVNLVPILFKPSGILNRSQKSKITDGIIVLNFFFCMQDLKIYIFPPWGKIHWNGGRENSCHEYRQTLRIAFLVSGLVSQFKVTDSHHGHSCWEFWNIHLYSLYRTLEIYYWFFQINSWPAFKKYYRFIICKTFHHLTGKHLCIV